MDRHYLFFVTLGYAYSILRPLQREILRRGDEVRWFLDDGCPDMLLPEEHRAATIEEVIAWNPEAVFTPGNYVYHFFPGVKVQLFHGYPIGKRQEKVDDSFRLRGWFDIYCTQGPSSTPTFQQLSHEKGYFKVYETGWCKVDDTFAPPAEESADAPSLSHSKAKSDRPVILYGTTFTKGITSAPTMLPVIDRLASEEPWDWILTFHPKLDAGLVEQYREMAARHPNVTFERQCEGAPTYRKADVMLCDSSSIILEFMMLNKPVVTYRNTQPGPHLIDVHDPADVGPAIRQALTRPAELMAQVDRYARYHESGRDGRNSARVLDAVDDFIAHYQGRLKSKPLNLVRKLKLRWHLKYFGHLLS